MYEELVKRLREESEIERWLQPHSANETPKLLDDAADAIEKLSNAGSIYGEAWTLGYDAGRDENKPRWIPVTERLPEEEKRTYWVCTDTGYQCECRWTNNIFGIGESDKWGWSIADVPQYHKVMAWMFLPEPYEPPKEET